jgi:S1-C subfamily serine protease
MTTGGMLLETLPDEDRQKAGLPEKRMALRVRHVGQSGPHAAAKNAGFRQGDILVSYDGRTDLLRESDLFAQGALQHKPGDKVSVTVWRDGKQLELTLPMQE